MKTSKLLLFPLLFILTFSGCQNDNDASFPGVIQPNDFLSSNRFNQLVVEIQYVKGYQPQPQTIDNLKTFLENRLNKPAGITIVQRELISPGKTSYSFDDIKEIERQNRTEQARNKKIAAYFLFLDGGYANDVGDSKVLGIAYGSSSMTIFKKTIQDYSGGITQPSESVLETVVVHHEFAHILGLVNNGTTMVSEHQDEAHGAHCDNTNCLMYYSAETSDVVGNLVGGNIPELDEKCIQDLRANGGK